MTGLQESVTVGVNQDGQGPLVINVSMCDFIYIYIWYDMV